MARCSAFLQYSYEDDVFVNMTFANGNATTLTDDVPNRTIQGLQITPMRQVKLSCHSQLKHAIEEFTLLTKTKASFSKMHCNVENAGKRNVPKAKLQRPTHSYNFCCVRFQFQIGKRNTL